MAFNFNWSPLIADTSRAKEMLTTALNKSPKPPIIVDDIIVNELNLGSVPPELEILEIGDLAEDRFRGIFKMSYTGDAYLTLKTRVQANPLNTYLSTKPSFASPQPLAAATGLTIPIQITLSDIRLSGFVILVFSRQKGITLVFRNDPLESLKVSSTFDSIPFIKEYLQREIEGQLRVLFMDDLPAIIHRLSLRVWSPEHQQLEENEKRAKEEQQPVDPLASPPQNASYGNGLEDSDASFSLDDPTEMHASFSQKNLLRLAALTESQRTLSLFTPSMRDTVYRAWAGALERSDSPGASTPLQRPFTLARMQSSVSTASAWSSAASETSDGSSVLGRRPSFTSHTTAPTSYSMSTHRSRAHGNRKRKHRVVNLRKHRDDPDVSDAASVSTEYTASTSAPSVPTHERPKTPPRIEFDHDVSTPPRQSTHKVRFHSMYDRTAIGMSNLGQDRNATPRAVQQDGTVDTNETTPRPASFREESAQTRGESRPSLSQTRQTQSFASEKRPALPRSLSSMQIDSSAMSGVSGDGFTGGILEHAWMMKVQAENRRRAQWEKAARIAEGFWDRPIEEDQESPPPAYGV